MEAVSVKVTKFGDRKFWLMYYDDPMTGKRVTRSTKDASKKGAQKAAGKWEAELREGRYKPASTIDWPTFRERYEAEVLPGLALKTGSMVASVFNSIERIVNPQKLRDLSAGRLSYYQSKLREAGLSEATIRSYLAHLKSALKWGVKMGMLHTAPEVVIAKRAKGVKFMKGRPITTEEFERMLGKVVTVLAAPMPGKAPKRAADAPPKRTRKESTAAADKARREKLAHDAAPSWARLLRGLWLSGLRLGEALNLYWDREDKLGIDLAGRRPMFKILGELEKGGKDRLLPMTPDFAEFLSSIPEAERTGPVFPLTTRRGDRAPVGLEWVSATIARIGAAAGVKVDTDPKTGKVKFASAHDLRRSFGSRWAPRVMPTVLRQMMRHAEIETTMRYYVGQNADDAADEIWSAAERVNTFVNTGHSKPASDNGRDAVNTVAVSGS